MNDCSSALINILKILRNSNVHYRLFINKVQMKQLIIQEKLKDINLMVDFNVQQSPIKIPLSEVISHGFVRRECELHFIKLFNNYLLNARI